MPRRYHRGMARQRPLGHDGIKPGEVADDMSAYHLTRHAPNLVVEGDKQLENNLEVAMAEFQSFRGKGHDSVQGQLTRSRGQAGAPSPDLSTGTHLSGGLRRSSSESSAAAGRCSCQSKREEEDEGERRGATGRAGRGHLVGFDQVGWRRQVGPAR
jgi:hypothetical protein